MKIYTKTGDDGETSLFGGDRVNKTNIRIEAYGTVDELNSLIGLLLCEDIEPRTNEILNNVQNTLFIVGSELATPKDVKSTLGIFVSSDDVKNLEDYIDELEVDLKPLKSFILPGGKKSASYLHVIRTVCRRAERRIVEIGKNEISSDLLAYMNRLSDLLFVLSRFENHSSSIQEIEWKPRG